MSQQFYFTAEHIGDELVAEVRGSATDTVAYYIEKNGVNVHKQWYSSEKIFRYPIAGQSGVFKVAAFLKNANGDIFQQRSNERVIYGRPVTLPEITAETATFGASRVKCRNNVFHCLLAPKPNATKLFVLLTAAVDRVRTGSTPVFNRWTWRDKFPGHVLCIADPTLDVYPGVSIGWYLGSKDNDATEDMAEVVRRYARALNIGIENVVTYGSSAGGFAAMTLASHLGGATAVAINPQTNALKYSRKRVEEMLAACFPAMDELDVAEEFDHRLNAASALTGSKSKVIFVQNKLDSDHWEPHYLPFASKMNMPTESGLSEDGKHRAIVYKDEKGHAPEPPEIFEDILSLVRPAQAAP